jgi:hypothetical protein
MGSPFICSEDVSTKDTSNLHCCQSKNSHPITVAGLYSGNTDKKTPSIRDAWGFNIPMLSNAYLEREKGFNRDFGGFCID